MTKEYVVPEEAAILFSKLAEYRDARDVVIGRALFWKRAKYFADLAAKARVDAWDIVYKTYPELIGKSLSYTTTTGILSVTNANEVVE